MFTLNAASLPIVGLHVFYKQFYEHYACGSELPADVTSAFRQRLKTHLFLKLFPGYFGTLTNTSITGH